MTVVPGPRGWPLAYDYQAAGRSVRIARRRRRLVARPAPAAVQPDQRPLRLLAA
ncbi:hypothetical protein ACRAWD_14150 [Caulobacter segnis]